MFSGRRGDYNDPPSPTTLYGKNLVAVEKIVREHCPDACIVRPSYLYGFSGGKLDGRLETARRRLLSGEPVRYADDMYKSPMEISHAADAVTKLAHSSYVGTVHISGVRSSVYEFYRDALNALGVPTAALHSDRLPVGTKISRDTSLDAALMTRLTGVSVLGVREALGGGSFTKLPGASGNR